MTNFFVVNNNQNMHDKDRNVLMSQSQKLIRQNYKSPFKQTQQQLSKQHVTSPNRFVSGCGNDTLPPRAVPFRRSRNTSRERTDQIREQSDEFKHIRKVKEINLQSLLKVSSLQKKLNQQAGQKQKWRSLCISQEQKINNMILQFSQEKQQKLKMKIQMLRMKEDMLQKERKLAKSHQTIQNLNKTLKEYKINQKSLANLKNIQNQLDLVQDKNAKLTEQNLELAKNYRKLKNQLKKKDSTSESDMQVNKKCEKIQSLELQVHRLREQLHKDRTQRQNVLEETLRNLQKKLYEKQSQIKSMSIQLNFIDRKKYSSIDDVKAKKDQQIKDLKQKFLKVSRDLKQTKDKFESNQKKKIPKSIRKIKSSNLLGAHSQSEEVTFELSSQH